MKVLLVVSPTSDEAKNKILKAVAKYELPGIVMPTQSLANSFLRNEDEPVPVFGGLRNIVEAKENIDLTTSIFVIINKESLWEVKAAIKGSCADLTESAGSMFAVELFDYEESIN